MHNRKISFFLFTENQPILIVSGPGSSPPLTMGFLLFLPFSTVLFLLNLAS